MGCFNVAGGMSNISIGYNEKVVFIPLITTGRNHRIPKEIRKDGFVNIQPTSNLSSNAGSSTLYSPAFLPIKGRYDDYGSIRDIERDVNVEYIEDFFGISIEQFVDQIAVNGYGKNVVDCKDEKKDAYLKQLSGMFELHTIYEQMAQYGREINNAYENLELSKYTLNQLGFKYIPEDTNDAVYEFLYKHPSINEVVAHCNGPFSDIIDTKTNEELLAMYSVENLDEALKDLNIDLNNISPIINEYKKESTFYYILKGITDLLVNDIEKINFDLLAPELQEKYKAAQTEEEKDSIKNEQIKNNKMELYMINDYLENMRYWRHLRYCIDEKYTKEFADLLCFDDVMFKTNNIYSPTANGEQHGDHKASEVFYKACLDYVKTKI